MTDPTPDHTIRRSPPWRIIGWSVPVLLLLLPLVTGAPWTRSDYVIMGALFLIAGIGVEGAVWASGDTAYRLGAGAAIATAFLLIWVNMAVGFLGDENNPANLMFFAVLAVAFGGGLLSAFRAAGLARAMIAAAVCQVAVGVVAFVAGWASPGSGGLYEVVMGTGLFTGMWLVSAAFFTTSERRQRERAATPA
jgi:hypothetical protein